MLLRELAARIQTGFVVRKTAIHTSNSTRNSKRRIKSIRHTTAVQQGSNQRLLKGIIGLDLILSVRKWSVREKYANNGAEKFPS